MLKCLVLGMTSSLLILATNSAFAAVDYSVCPEVAKIPDGFFDPAITLKDVMYQFQDHLGAADEIIHSGHAGGKVDLTVAIDHIESAHNCALLAARNGKTTMQPSRVQTLPTEKRAEFLNAFTDAMSQFAALLQKQDNQLKQLLAAPEASRDYSAVYDTSMDIDDVSTKAHQKF